MNRFRIVTLNTKPETADAVSGLYLLQWPQWYGAEGPGDARQDLAVCLESNEALPSCLVALEGSGQVVGTGCLRETSPGSERYPGAWLTGLVVDKAYRRCGIGSALVAAAEAEALRLGFDALHASTSSAGSILVRREWTRIDQVTSSGECLDVFRKSL